MHQVSTALLLSTVLMSVGCASGPYAQRGTQMGTLIGAPVGAVIGSNNGEAAAGAIVGGTMGALIGNGIGADRDSVTRRHPILDERLTVAQVIAMTREGVGEELVITQIGNQGITSRPTANDLIALKNAGVSDRVVLAMQNSPDVESLGQRRPVIVEEHYWGRIPDPFCGPPSRSRFRAGPVPAYPRQRSTFSFTHRF